jgi:hypothetical protein
VAFNRAPVNRFRPTVTGLAAGIRLRDWIWRFCFVGVALAVGGHAQAQIVAAVLPSSRSVAVGHTATAFATIINAGATAATGCGVSMPTGIPATFSFNTTDPNTNAVTGALNTPATIPAGGFQTYVFAITPTAAFASTSVALSFTCSGLDPAPTLTGINTLLLTASATSLPDVVALAATTSGNGIVSLPTRFGSAAFAVATVNLGAADTISVSADTNGVTLPVSITICQTNSVTGACLATPTTTVQVPIGTSATPTFGIFVTGTDNVAPLPGADRIAVRFTSSGNTVVGSTSVAVQTTGYAAPTAPALSFAPGTPNLATTGSSYNFCYCQPTPSGVNGLCGSPTQSNPSGGHPPYHFQTGSGGFPPVGIILGLNGCLTGAPSIAGTRSFNVCAVDLNGEQVCRPSSITVQQGAVATTTVHIGGDVSLQATVTFDGVTIKNNTSSNLDYYAYNIATGDHSLVFSCPGADSYCFAYMLLEPNSGFSVTPTEIRLPPDVLTANSTLTRTFTVTKSP